MMKRIGYLLLPALLTVCTAIGQFPGLDRAREAIYGATTDQERLSRLQAASAFKNSMRGDTIYHYAQWAKQLALKLGDKKALARAEYSLISGDIASGKTDSVIPRIDRNKHFIGIKETDPDLYYKIQILKANVLNRTSRLNEALELQLQLLRSAEKENNTMARLFLINYVGATYLNTTGQRESARKTWESGLEIIRKANDPAYSEIETYLLSNLSLYYFGNYYTTPTPERFDSCLSFLNRTIDLCRKNESMGVLASTLSYRANLYGRNKMYKEAEADFTETVAIRNKIGDPLYITEDLKNLSFFYFERNDLEKCLAVINEGLLICERFHIRETVLDLLRMKAGVYQKKGDKAQYITVLEKLLLTGDTIYQVRTAEKIAKLQTEFDVQKKEALIAKQQLDLLKRNFLLYAAGIAALLLALYFILRFRKYKRKQQQLMEEKKRQHELQVKEAEEKERKRIASELHDNLGVQANAILYNSSQLATGTGNTVQIANDLQETAKEMLLNLRETLWAMKNSDVNAVQLWLRVINFMQQMGRHYTGIQFKVSGTAPNDFIIPANRALHIVLVIQETVNNSVKHARATTISAQSNLQGTDWTIILQDDGSGFDPDKAQSEEDRYGLKNIQERALAGTFSCRIESEPGNGTKTTLQIRDNR
jgi:signal transduction histidine kinase